MMVFVLFFDEMVRFQFSEKNPLLLILQVEKNT